MSFPIEETTVADIHTAMEARATSASDLVDAYLARIDAYDRAGPGLNAIVTVNPEARAVAERLDADFARTGEFRGALHGIPVVVKDQIETAGIMTTFGSIAMDGYVPEHDATVIRRLHAAGAIVLAKTAMPDFATAWFGYSSKSGARSGRVERRYRRSRRSQSRRARHRRGYRRFHSPAGLVRQPGWSQGHAGADQPSRYLTAGLIPGLGRTDVSHGRGCSAAAAGTGRL